MTDNIKIIGDKKLIAFLEKLTYKGTQEVRNEIILSANKIKVSYINGVEKNRKLGNLRKSIKMSVFHSGLSATVGSNLQVANYIEFGTKAHTIKAKNAKVLTNYNNISTNNISYFGKEVQHPGTSPNPALRKAYVRHIGSRGQKLIANIGKRLERIK